MFNGKNLKEIRAARPARNGKRFTQGNLARLVGVDPQTISRLERGGNPDYETLQKFEAALTPEEWALLTDKAPAAQSAVKELRARIIGVVKDAVEDRPGAQEELDRYAATIFEADQLKRLSRPEPESVPSHRRSRAKKRGGRRKK